MSSSLEPDTEFTQSGSVPLQSGSGVGANIEIDEHQGDREDIDSSIGSGLSSSTTSVSSSVFCFTYANGRRYHSDRFKKGQYFMPNDEAEQERLDLYHHIFLSLLGGKLYTAPLDHPQRVLDVGTGTGLWAIDFADEHEEAEVIGTDLSPIQPSWVPPNVRFEVDDMEEDWNFPNNYFDYIHMRSMSGSFADWDRVLQQAYDACAPGGYVEYQDYGCQMYRPDGTLVEGLECGDPLAEYFYHIVTAAERQGRPLLIAPGMKARMEKAGFVDVTAQTAIWPAGPWPKDKRLKEVGKWGLIGALDSLFPFVVYYLTKEGWSVDQVKVLCDRTANALHTNKYYTLGWFVYGRKPIAKK
ncbi:S-adenosyl-L-methionine-dependent methyltransferase [Kalaharituber pfeilii]|nr:S-adenosyl-L-methionine-dependent methyltransferase [Kalaharituber pfeilii]